MMHFKLHVHFTRVPMGRLINYESHYVQLRINRGRLGVAAPPVTAQATAECPG